MNQYWLEFRQYEKVVGRKLVTFAADYEKEAEEKASELLASGLIEQGYYDCFLYHDNSLLDHIILIA